MDIVWGDVSKNIEKAKNQIGLCPGADIYILPEMFSTGFNGDCETEPAQGLKAMQEIARERECAVAGSIGVEVQNGAKAESVYVVKADAGQWDDDEH